MKLVILYRPNSEYSRTTEEYVQEFKRLHPESAIEMINIDSIEGSAEAKLYDVVQYPALLAVASDGTLLNMWAGDQLPLMDEVTGYLSR